MKDVYGVAGVTKQALHKARIRSSKTQLQAFEFFEQADKIREEHPGVGCRKMALDLTCKGWGRDKVEQLFLNNGYRLYYPRRYKRTTDHRKDFYYPNLIEGMELNNINQVVQTDITYFRVKERFFYIVFLIDVYSRRIVGYSLSKSLHAQANIKALQKLVALRQGELSGLIHHSDRGSQYVDEEYRKLLSDQKVIPSMCKGGWENAYTERINRTIKEEYLDRWQIDDYATLSKMLKRAVNHYNHKRRHDSLKRKSPVAFERIVEKLSAPERPKTKIYKHLQQCPQKTCE